jgi:predicted adenine nucleotide alpha hydrolase (AANH) superfamily ATPase
MTMKEKVDMVEVVENWLNKKYAYYYSSIHPISELVKRRHDDTKEFIEFLQSLNVRVLDEDQTTLHMIIDGQDWIQSNARFVKVKDLIELPAQKGMGKVEE